MYLNMNKAMSNVPLLATQNQVYDYVGAETYEIPRPPMVARPTEAKMTQTLSTFEIPVLRRWLRVTIVLNILLLTFALAVALMFFLVSYDKPEVKCPGTSNLTTSKVPLSEICPSFCEELHSPQEKQPGINWLEVYRNNSYTLKRHNRRHLISKRSARMITNETVKNLELLSELDPDDDFQPRVTSNNTIMLSSLIGPILQSLSSAPHHKRRNILTVGEVPFFKKRILNCIARMKAGLSLRCDAKTVRDQIEHAYKNTGVGTRSSNCFSSRAYFNVERYRSTFRNTFSEYLKYDGSDPVSEADMVKSIYDLERIRIETLVKNRVMRRYIDTITTVPYYVLSDVIRYENDRVKFTYHHNPPCCFMRPNTTISSRTRYACAETIFGDPIFIYTDWNATHLLWDDTYERVRIWSGERADDLCSKLNPVLVSCKLYATLGVFKENTYCLQHKGVYDEHIQWLQLILGGGLY